MIKRYGRYNVWKYVKNKQIKNIKSKSNKIGIWITKRKMFIGLQCLGKSTVHIIMKFSSG